MDNSYNLPVDLIFLMFSYLSYSDADKLLDLKNEKITKLIQKHKWNDTKTTIKYNLNIWKEKFPNAIGVKIDDKSLKISNDDFVYLREVKHLYINTELFEYTRNVYITDESFENLTNLETLSIHMCYKCKITDNAFKNLKGINTLNINIYGCYGLGSFILTDKMFEYLPNIHTLNISECSNFTDKMFEYLPNIHTLNISDCKQFTDNIFENLKGLKNLNIVNCNTFTNKALSKLKNIQNLIQFDDDPINEDPEYYFDETEYGYPDD